MPLFEYEPLVVFAKLEILNEEEDKGDIHGVGPSNTKIVEQSKDLRGGKDGHEREAIEQTLEQVNFFWWEVSFQEYTFIAT